jgi:hypothetical protein
MIVTLESKDNESRKTVSQRVFTVSKLSGRGAGPLTEIYDPNGLTKKGQLANQ